MIRVPFLPQYCPTTSHSVYAAYNLFYNPKKHLTSKCALAFDSIINPYCLQIRYISVSNVRSAPKPKRGGKVGSKEQSDATNTVGNDHLFNIYQSIPQDHELLPDKYYPDWLWKLTDIDKSYGELVLMFIHGKVTNFQFRISIRPLFTIIYDLGGCTINPILG